MQTFLFWSVVVCGVAMIVSGVFYQSASGVIGFGFGALALVAYLMITRKLDNQARN